MATHLKKQDYWESISTKKQHCAWCWLLSISISKNDLLKAFNTAVWSTNHELIKYYICGKSDMVRLKFPTLKFETLQHTRFKDATDSIEQQWVVFRSTSNIPLWSDFHNCHPSHFVTMKNRVDYRCRTTPSREKAGMDIQHATEMEYFKLRIGTELKCMQMGVQHWLHWGYLRNYLLRLSDALLVYALKGKFTLHNLQLLSEYRKGDERGRKVNVLRWTSP